jgi:hypothetical protein
MHYLLTRASIMVRSGSGVQGPFADVHEMYLEISIVKEQSCHRKLLPVLFLPYVATCRRERKSLHRRVANGERSDVAPCCRLQSLQPLLRGNLRSPHVHHWFDLCRCPN